MVAYGTDWPLDLADARARVGRQVALQGNMDPSILYASPARIRHEVETILASYGRGSGVGVNLGHGSPRRGLGVVFNPGPGIHQGIDPERVAVFVDAVHELSRPYHPNP